MVSGKGGAGKSTAAAALALSLAGRGKQVLLCEVEGRQGIAHIFGVGDLGPSEVRIAAGLGGPSHVRGGGSVFALHIDPEDALREYLATYFKLGPAAKALEAFGVVEFATSIAPGLRDVLLTGKVYEATKPVRRGKNSRSYDAVVLDAPPTGRIKQFLTANAELAGLAKMGPIKNQAESVMTTLAHPQRHPSRDPPGGDVRPGDRRGMCRVACRRSAGEVGGREPDPTSRLESASSWRWHGPDTSTRRS